MKKLLIIILVFFLVVSATGLFIYFKNTGKSHEHEIFSKLYVEYFIKDNPAKQYELLDINKIF